MFLNLVTLLLTTTLVVSGQTFVPTSYWFLPGPNDTVPVTGRICPIPFPQDGAFCCFNGPYMYSANFSNSDFQSISKWFPETRGTTLKPDDINRRKAYLSPYLDPNIYLDEKGGYLDITLVNSYSAYRNQIGLFLFDANKKIIPNSKMDIFADAVLANPPAFQTPTTYCHQRGDTVRIGPFQPFAQIGLYIHVNGANYYANSAGNVASCTKNVTKLRECVNTTVANKNVYKCYTDTQCYYEPNFDNNANTFFTIDSLNSDKLRHMAVISLLNNASGLTNIYYGFEDAPGGGDRDYNDVLIRIQTSSGQPNLPKICDPPCDPVNGYCDYVTGTCKCNSLAPVLSYDGTCGCDCGCKNGGTCNCQTAACQCLAGFQGEKCQCVTAAGFCTTASLGTGSVAPTWTMTWTCGVNSSSCVCSDTTKYTPKLDGYTTPSGNVYKVGFGAAGTNATLLGWTELNIGAMQTLNSSLWGSSSWNVDMRNQVRVSSVTGGFILMAKDGTWTIFLRGNTFYDIEAVLGGDSVSSINTLSVIHQFNTSAILAAGLTVNADSLATVRTRVRTPADGRLVFRNTDVNALTRLASLSIIRSACSCKKCVTCNDHGTCDCDTGTCTCDAAWKGSADCKCATPVGVCQNGGNMLCATGKCNCTSGWEGDLCQNRVCQYPNCTANGGSCSVVTGICTCPVTKSGADCSCNFPQNMVCLNGGSKNCTTGVCNCPAGWKGVNCGCKSICPNMCSGNGVCQCDGTCNCPAEWQGPSVFGGDAQDCSCRTPNAICVHGKLNCTTGNCTCNLGYTGPACDEVAKCGGNGQMVCQNNATCNYTTGICICKPGFIYNDCSCKSCTQSCNANNSVSTSICNCDGTCVCKPGYYGPSCNFKYCPNPCLNNGSCTLNGECNCTFPFFGDTCQLKNCSPSCVDENTEVCDTNNGKCICKNLYYGDQCQFKNCSSPCLNGGSCTLEGTCDCSLPFFGSNLKECAINDCKAGYCDYNQGTCVCDPNWSKTDPNDYNGSCNCSTVPCFSSNDKPCSGHGTCNCKTCKCDAGWSGPDCSCTTQRCQNDCSGHGSCSCGVCYCNYNWTSSDCSVPTCPRNSYGVFCNGRGTCNENNGTCTCNENWSGANCDSVCIKDACGDCNGNGLRCMGCDGIYNSGVMFDVCNVCGGDNSTCAGCDSVPYSGKVKDICGVCGGDGTTCRQELLCNQRKSCTSCNQKSISFNNTQFCGWCNATQSCHDIKKMNLNCSVANACPLISTNVTINDSLISNDEGTTTYYVAGGIAGAVIVGASFAALLFLNHRKNMQHVLEDSVWANAAVSNPLYRNLNSSYQNPLYRQPVQGNDEDLGY